MKRNRLGPGKLVRMMAAVLTAIAAPALPREPQNLWFDESDHAAIEARWYALPWLEQGNAARAEMCAEMKGMGRALFDANTAWGKNVAVVSASNHNSVHHGGSKAMRHFRRDGSARVGGHNSRMPAGLS